MKRHSRRHFASLYLLAAAVCSVGTIQADDRDGIEFFERKIRPVLVKYCYECHSADADSVQGGLVVDSRQGIRRGGESGPVLIEGKPEQSDLIAALRYESVEMPPTERLPDSIVHDFEQWIKMNAPDPREATIHAAPTSEIDFEAGREFWSFEPPQRHPTPEVADADWSITKVDRFVLQRLEESELTPNPQAAPVVLLRRLSYDLIGLPPTAKMLRQFLDDPSPVAYRRMVDRLLASPGFGERWSRMWMDVMRYAEDQAHIVGSNRSLCYPNAYRYRDWLIAAWNQDMPYDQFIRLQLAADLIAPKNPDLHVALGFIGLGPKYYRRGDLEVMADEWEDRIDTLTRGLLGLTVACARCHDHKFDPVSTEDYYALAGVFASTEMFNKPLSDAVEKTKDGSAKKPEDAYHLVRDRDPRDLNVMIRGDVNRLGPAVPRRFLSVLCEGDPVTLDEGSGRAQLAEAIVAADNPLVARVLVNRVWAEIFDNPLVETTSNFGRLGSSPTHPRLLDDLAVRFVENGWSLKWLIRELVHSAAYRQSGRIQAEAMAVDPDNRLLWRREPRRLSVEQYRDALLQAAGLLDHQLGGKSIAPDDLKTRRRTVYSEISRLEVHPMLARFDFPDPNAHSPGRVETTTPLQKLFLLNSPFMVHVSQRLADHLEKAEPDNLRRILLAYETVYGREATPEEVQIGMRYLSDATDSRLVDYCQALLAANEMFMID